jgi:hypothetical protein
MISCLICEKIRVALIYKFIKRNQGEKSKVMLKEQKILRYEIVGFMDFKATFK